MVSGKLGLALAIGILICLPVEKFNVQGLGPTDGFVVLLMLTTWPVFWGQHRRIYFPLALGMWLIFIGSLIGTLSGPDISVASFALLQEVYLFGMFVTVANAITDRAVFLVFGRCWAIIAAVESALLVLGRFGFVLPFFRGGGKTERFIEVGRDPIATLSSYGRATGSFLNANAAGAYLLLSLFILLILPSPRSRLARGALIALFTAGILATGSNGALLGTAVGLGIAVHYWLYRRGRAILFSLGLGSVAVTVIILSLPLIVSFLGSVGKGSALFAFSRPDDKLSDRVGIWTEGIELFTEYPLGIGPNVNASVTSGSLHNDFVAFMTERGPLGFIGLIALIGEVLFWLGLASRRGTSWTHHRTTGALLGGLAGIWVMATSHEISHGRPLWLLFAMIFLHYKFLRSEIEPVQPAVPAQTRSALAGL